MARKANAANITKGLAQLGGGAKKDGGGGMMEGMQVIFKTGVQVGNKFGLEGKDVTATLDEISKLLIEKK